MNYMANKSESQIFMIFCLMNLNSKNGFFVEIGAEDGVDFLIPLENTLVEY